MDHVDLAPTAERLLQHLKRHGPRPVAVLAAALGLTAEAARLQLRKLAGAGLVAAQAGEPNADQAGEANAAQAGEANA
ncbi:helix-turn-helix domain-containing protein, partial [Roseomonas sp. 18066]|uniref:helix-turn-helix domain-containing protein n=1 Tax=Roseomonas sp. 18066 TaxID=2681412 RepID=UPI0013599F00